MSWLERTALLIQEEGLAKLQGSNVLVVGLGGVGSFAAEFIARAGVGKMTIVDGDVFDITNKNRQLPALDSTIGKHKVTIMADRIKEINPDIELTAINEFLSPERAKELVTSDFDYVMDCIDSLTPKLNLLIAAKRRKVKIISSMGAGGKLDASKVKVADISNTRDCTFARQIRKRLKKEGINKGIRAVYSTEVQIPESVKTTDGKNYKRSYYGTISYMPAAFGLQAASEVIRYLLKKK